MARNAIPTQAAYFPSPDMRACPSVARVSSNSAIFGAFAPANDLASSSADAGCPRDSRADRTARAGSARPLGHGVFFAGFDLPAGPAAGSASVSCVVAAPPGFWNSGRIK